jgi:hypothetical protein
MNNNLNTNNLNQCIESPREEGGKLSHRLRLLTKVGIVTLLLVAGIALPSLAALSDHPQRKQSSSEREQAASRATSKQPPQASPQIAERGISFRSAMERLPQNVRLQFLESLMFKNGRLATAYIGGIKSHLPPTQYNQVLLALGVQAGQDYQDFACDGVATCFKKKDSICISANCTVGPKGFPLGVLLASLSTAERSRFLESLDFAGGKLVRANVASIRSRLSQPQVEQLFNGMGISRAEIQKATGTYSRQ